MNSHHQAGAGLAPSDDASEPDQTAEQASSHVPPSAVLFVDCLALLKCLCIRSAAAVSESTSGETQRVEEHEWLLGSSATTSSSTVPSLLDSIRVDRPPFEDPSQPLRIHFKTLNLWTDSAQPTGILDRQGNAFTVGDLVFFALQLQTHVTSSRHITTLGHVPISFLLRKPLASVLQDPDVLPEKALPHYNPNQLTPVWVDRASEPISVDTMETFQKIFRRDPGVDFGHDVLLAAERLMISGTSTVSEPKEEPISDDSRRSSSFIRLLDPPDLASLLRRPRRHRDNTAAPPPTAISVGSAILAVQNGMASHHQQLILPGSSPIASRVLRVYDKFMAEAKRATAADQAAPRRITTPSPPKRRTESAAPRLAMTSKTVQQQAPPFSAKQRPTSKESAAETMGLYYYLKTKRLKPIIIVPAAGISSTILHIGNIRHFLHEKQLPPPLPSSLAGAEPSPVGGGGHAFSWAVSVPIPHPLKGEEVVSAEFKIVDSSQVSKFRRTDWYRTVAVILQGPEWQLSGWPFASVEMIFKCIKPFYFAFETDPLPQLVKTHGVEVLRLRRASRHNDPTAWHHLLTSLGTVLRTSRNFCLFDSAIMRKLYDT